MSTSKKGSPAPSTVQGSVQHSNSLVITFLHSELVFVRSQGGGDPYD